MHFLFLHCSHNLPTPFCLLQPVSPWASKFDRLKGLYMMRWNIHDQSGEICDWDEMSFGWPSDGKKPIGLGSIKTKYFMKKK